MCTKLLELNFKVLVNYSDENLHETVPLNQAVKATLEANKNSDVPQIELYKTWALFLFKQYGAAKIKCNELNQLLELFTSVIDQLLQECQEEEVTDELTACLDYSSELFNWIQTVAGDIQCEEMATFLCFGLSVVSSFLAFISSEVQCGKTNTLLEKALSIQHAIVSIISEHLETFNFAGGRETLLNDLMQHLCTVGEQTPKLDIKIAVDTWRGITRLACNNVPPAPAKPSSFLEIPWLKKPLCFLINEIGRNIQTVYKEPSLSGHIEQIKKYLKVTKFYLRLLQKLAIDFSHATFPAYSEFFNTLVIILRPPPHIVETNAYSIVTEYVADGYKDVIPIIYRNPLFFEQLINEKWDVMEPFYEILLQVIEISIQRSQTDCLTSSILDEAFRRFSKNFHLFLSSPIYNLFIETFSALYIHSEMKHLQNLLVESVLQDDVILASSAIDIWCIIFQNDNNRRMEYFTFWRNINELFATFSDQLHAVYVEQLLKRLYPLLSPQEKAEMWDNFNLSDLKNTRFLLTIGVDAITNGDMKLIVIEHFVTELENFPRQIGNGSIATEHYYAIVRNLKLLAPLNCFSRNLVDVVLQYHEIALKNKKFNLLLESVWDFLSPKLKKIDHSKILNILTDISAKLNIIRKHSTKMSLIELLRNVMTIPQLERHSREILKIIEDGEAIQYFADTIEGPKLEHNEDLLKEVLRSRTIETEEAVHECETADKISPERKKRKTDVDMLIESIETNVDKLISEIHLENLEPDKASTLLRLGKKLSGIFDFS